MQKKKIKYKISNCVNMKVMSLDSKVEMVVIPTEVEGSLFRELFVRFIKHIRLSFWSEALFDKLKR